MLSTHPEQVAHVATGVLVPEAHRALTLAGLSPFERAGAVLAADA